ncbi:MAG: hypothetical protein OEL86_14300 [Sulfuritalea sp.]|nr:hypothetical protein [Sulfuritalea sp.]
MPHPILRLLLVIATTLFALSACSRPGEKFIGTWSNEWAGGQLHLVVSRDGDNFILKEIHTVTGGTVAINAARFENGYLTSDNVLRKKLAYVESEDAIQPLDLPMVFPAFRRVKN